MADVCCLAFRVRVSVWCRVVAIVEGLTVTLSHHPQLNKPLACRLFPVKGKAAHDLTTFKHPHLCNCSVFPVP